MQNRVKDTEAMYYERFDMNEKRVVITGTGVISSLGLDSRTFWKNIKAGKNGISSVKSFPTEHMPTKVASEIMDFNPEDFIDKKDARRMDRFAQFALAAAYEAYSDSGLDKHEFDKTRMGVHVASGIGGLHTIEDQYETYNESGSRRISPFTVTMMIPNIAAGKIAIDLGAKGPAECAVTACASSAYSVGNALRLIQRGDADVVVAGGAEAPISGFAFSAFAANRSISFQEDPNKACLPFDINRSGFVMGEGGAILILEELEHAKRRGARIMAEMTGYAATCDAFHYTAPEPEGDGAYRCMENAMADAGISNEDVQHINSHGTGTILNDKTEAMAVRRLFGEQEKNIYINATKSMTGHSLGAVGALEVIITAKTIKENYIPPTINVEEQDPECGLSRLVIGKGVSAEIRNALTNSFGFGGHNAVIVLKKYED